ncbi:MAG TPA: hypothetical protein IAC21_04870 [Candidatus Enterenecus merdae]|nr:hypothetical protein [Candidatus Enterenecus merdae]
MNRLNRFRAPLPAPPLGRRFGCLLGMLLAGAAVGVLAKWADFSDLQLLGDMFSELPVWILLGLLIARFSGSPGRAAAYAFAFFVAMIPAYYLAAEWMGGVWGMAFVCGWTAVACLSPLAAYTVWYAFGRGWLPNLMSTLAVAAALLSDVAVFRSFNFRDIVLALLCALLVFACKAPKQLRTVKQRPEIDTKGNNKEQYNKMD